jgi:hypothetical protein
MMHIAGDHRACGPPPAIQAIQESARQIPVAPLAHSCRAGGMDEDVLVLEPIARSTIAQISLHTKSMVTAGHRLSKNVPGVTGLHAGGKFGSTGYKVSGRLHGAGVQAVNALGDSLKIEIRRPRQELPECSHDSSE